MSGTTDKGGRKTDMPSGMSKHVENVRKAMLAGIASREDVPEPIDFIQIVMSLATSTAAESLKVYGASPEVALKMLTEVVCKSVGTSYGIDLTLETTASITSEGESDD